MKKNNSGFTLVEIMVAVTILSIISIMLVAFIGFGTVGYTRTNNKVSLQKESQASMNQITEMLMDATNGVTYSVNGTKVDNDENFHIVTDAAVSHKTVCIFNRVVDSAGTVRLVESEIEWEESTKQLLYAEYEIEKDASGNYKEGPVQNEGVLAQNVEKFVVDLSKVGVNNTVLLEMAFKVKDQTFEAKKTITLRNQILVNKGLNQTFEVTSVVLNPTVDDVILNPSDVYVNRGESYEGFQVTVVGQNYPGQDCTWEIVNKTDLTDVSGTSINSANGKIKIGANETCSSIQVKATSNLSKTLAGADTSLYVSDTATVLNKYISGMSITEVLSGADLKATAIINVNGVNFQGNEDYSSNLKVDVYDVDTKLPDGAVEIVSIEKTASDAVAMTSSYAVVIRGSQKYVNKELTLKATIAGSGSDSASAKGTFEFERSTLKGIRIEVKEDNGKWGKYVVGENRASKRGETIDLRFVATYAFEDGTTEEKLLTSADSEWKDIIWSSSFSDGSSLGDRVQDNIKSAGTLKIESTANAFGYQSSYDFIICAKYAGLEAKAKIVLPKVKLDIINQHPDAQCRVGILVADGKSQHAATVRFDVAGLIPDPGTILFEQSNDSKLQVERIGTTNEFLVYTEQKGTDSVKFFLSEDSFIYNDLNIAAYEPNVKNGDKVLPYYVPKDNASNTFFNSTQKQYFDLYGNTFLYPTKGEMKFSETTYQYDNSSSAWIMK